MASGASRLGASPGGRSARLGRLSPKRRQLEVSPSTSGAARQGASVWLIGTQGDMRRPQSRSYTSPGPAPAPACRLREDTGMFGCRSRPPCSAPAGGAGARAHQTQDRQGGPSAPRHCVRFRRSLPAGGRELPRWHPEFLPDRAHPMAGATAGIAASEMPPKQRSRLTMARGSRPAGMSECLRSLHIGTVICAQATDSKAVSAEQLTAGEVRQAETRCQKTPIPRNSVKSLTHSQENRSRVDTLD